MPRTFIVNLVGFSAYRYILFTLFIHNIYLFNFIEDYYLYLFHLIFTLFILTIFVSFLSLFIMSLVCMTCNFAKYLTYCILVSPLNTYTYKKFIIIIYYLLLFYLARVLLLELIVYLATTHNCFNYV